MMALTSDTHMKPFLKVFINSHQHIFRNSGNFFTNGLLEFFKDSWMMFKNLGFEVPSQEKVTGAQIEGAR